mmetsp:Transcript_25273/g.58945  ORF Transcript_25273/g.58945 Transcript_25273/m.58945 type:complete len:172 (-) Transcript_25273:401-916(-)|eukprot:CAMPEP_0119362896 /NCGR_PEP_ID=MMETSP1334-20130426/9796_1 /TAXON_ID=127549 /ORGANISM="Calcidiscus leptoporus, Strain RCC1130" /LENGTH=171 /DNA_ID=CAMNT_0007378165 /DNA_START=47 /DNA_END=562 /DNA_ORIENTATION=-
MSCCPTFELKKAAASVICFDAIVLIVGIVQVIVDDFNTTIGTTQIVLGATGLVAAFVGLCLPKSVGVFMLGGAIASGLVGAAFAGMGIWTAVWMSDFTGSRDAWWWVINILSCLVLFMAAVDHFVLSICFMLEFDNEQCLGDKKSEGDEKKKKKKSEKKDEEGDEERGGKL